MAGIFNLIYGGYDQPNIPYAKVCLLLVCQGFAGQKIVFCVSYTKWSLWETMLLWCFVRDWAWEEATLMDSSEYHLHYCDFRNSLNVAFLNFFSDAQQHLFPINLGTYITNYFQPKLLESYGTWSQTPVSGEIFGHDRLRFYCFQVWLVTC